MDELPFYLFCKLCEDIRNVNVSPRKRTALIFTQKFRNVQRTGKTYSFMRLILPQCDKERAGYSVQESKLSSLLVKTMGWDAKSSEAAYRLKDWKVPMPPMSEKVLNKAKSTEVLKSNFKHSFRANVVDFGMVVEDVLLAKGFDFPPNKMVTLKAVNDFLDEFQEASNELARRNVIMKVITKFNACQMAWLVRLILKELRLGVGHEIILKEFHPDAIEFYNKTGDLRKICEQLVDLNQHYETNITLFSPFDPMLAKVESLSYVFKNFGDLLVEEKFDGERCLIHLNKFGTEKVSFYSRNHVDYTKHYLPQFANILLSAKINAETAILDGEILAFDSTSHSFMEIGNNLDVAAEVNDLISAKKDFRLNRRWLFVKIFDIIYLNGAILTHLTLRERREKLRFVVPVEAEVENVLNVVAQVVIGKCLPESDKLARVKEIFKHMVSTNREGLVVKNSESKYTFNRGGGWAKIKKDYYSTLRDTLDLIILGARFDKGRIASYFVGVKNDALSYEPKEEEKNPFNSFFSTDEYLVLCEVSAGTTNVNYEILSEKLGNSWEDFDKTSPPFFIKSYKSSGKFPSCYVKPVDSVVLEVAASEIVEAENSTSNFTLRFPRIIRIRPDKNPTTDTMRYSDLVRLYSVSKGSDIIFTKAELAEELLSDTKIDRMNLTDFSQEKKRKRVSSKNKRKIFFNIAEKNQGPESTKQLHDFPGISSKIFEGLRFYVVSGRLDDATELEVGESGTKMLLEDSEDIKKLIEICSGTILQLLPEAGVDYIICPNYSSPELESLRTLNKFDIYSVEFIKSVLACGTIEEDTLNDSVFIYRP